MPGKSNLHFKNARTATDSISDSSTGLLVSTGPVVWTSKADVMSNCPDFAAQGYVCDIYVAFVAYGWHWGGKYIQSTNHKVDQK